MAGLLAASLVSTGCLAAEIGRHTLMSAKESHEWRAVGRINVSGYKSRQMCSGALIRPDVVLTAAHCVINPRTGAAHAADRLNFVAGWHKGQKTGHRRGRAVLVHDEWPLGAPLSTVNVATDVALIRLESAMAAKEAPPFSLASAPRPDSPILLISYRRDRPHALSRQEDCRYLSNRGGILRLDCQVIQGASGSPIFLDEAGGIFGVLSAKRRGLAFAAPIDGVVQEMLTRLP